MNSIRLGYSTGGKKPLHGINERIGMIAQIQRDAIEIGYVRAERMEEPIGEEALDLVRGFGYRSIHAPTRITTDPNTFAFQELRYPSPETHHIVERLKELANIIHADTIVFHPDVVEDFAFVCDAFPQLIAFENMDKDKTFGRSVQDMEKVFQQAPEARLVLDINHIYTNDPSLASVVDFYTSFHDRIAHFHISAYGGFHAAFSETGEMFLMDPISDFSRPIIHEGGAAKNDLAFLQQEDDLIRPYLTVVRDRLAK